MMTEMKSKVFCKYCGNKGWQNEKSCKCGNDVCHEIKIQSVVDEIRLYALQKKQELMLEIGIKLANSNQEKVSFEVQNDGAIILKHSGTGSIYPDTHSGKQVIWPFEAVGTPNTDLEEVNNSAFPLYFENGYWLVPTAICYLGGCDMDFIECKTEYEASQTAMRLSDEGFILPHTSACTSCFSAYMSDCY